MCWLTLYVYVTRGTEPFSWGAIDQEALTAFLQHKLDWSAETVTRTLQPVLAAQQVTSLSLSLSLLFFLNNKNIIF